MPNISFTSLLLVTAVAFLAPLILGFLPIRGLPDVVLEIVVGIVIGPSVLGWARIDLPIQILSLIGLAFLLFLSGLEVDLSRLRGRLFLLVGAGFVLSLIRSRPKVPLPPPVPPGRCAIAPPHLDSPGTSPSHRA